MLIAVKLRGKTMPDVLVRDIDVFVLEKLKGKAKRRKTSVQSELKTLITNFADSPEPLSKLEMIRKIRASNTKINKTDSADLLREDRDR